MSEKQIVHPKLQTISEGNVVEYVLERFEDVKKNNKIKDLVSFQAMNKYMLMAHNQSELNVEWLLSFHMHSSWCQKLVRINKWTARCQNNLLEELAIQ